MSGFEQRIEPESLRLFFCCLIRWMQARSVFPLGNKARSHVLPERVVYSGLLAVMLWQVHPPISDMLLRRVSPSPFILPFSGFCSAAFMKSAAISSKHACR